MSNLSRGKTLVPGEFGIEQSDLPSYEDARIDPRAWFAHPERPFELEIGSGKGTFLVQEGEARPEVNFLGIEHAGPFYRYAADRFRRRQLEQLRILHGDAVEFITWWCADAIADAIHLYFSDPWPKARHHKRRVLQDRTIRQFHRVLRPSGRLHLVTDHEDLWAWYEEHAERNAELFRRDEFERPVSAVEGEWVGTNYERKFAIQDGRPIYGMTLTKVG